MSVQTRGCALLSACAQPQLARALSFSLSHMHTGIRAHKHSDSGRVFHLGLSGCTVILRSAARVIVVVGPGVLGGRGRATWAHEGTHEPKPSVGRRAPPRHTVFTGGRRAASVHVHVHALRKACTCTDAAAAAVERGRRPCSAHRHHEPPHAWQSALPPAQQDETYCRTHGAKTHGAAAATTAGPRARSARCCREVQEVRDSVG